MTELCTVQYCGGLGNQLFQIFTLFSYCIDNKKIPVLHHSESSPSITPRYTYWDTLFKEIKNFGDLVDGVIIHECVPFIYSSLPVFKENITLSGYFQSYKYFFHNKDRIIDSLKINFQLDGLRSRFSNTYLKKVSNETLVSVHFRLGDYKKLQQHHPILRPSYYINAINELRNRGINNIKILYFCEEEDSEVIQTDYLTVLKVESIERVNNMKDYEEMLLMACTDWNVIANSTFSWWGAFLNKNQNVIYPKKWFHSETSLDLIPNNWISTSI